MGAARLSIFTGAVKALTLSDRPCRLIGQEGRTRGGVLDRGGRTSPT